MEVIIPKKWEFCEDETPQRNQEINNKKKFSLKFYN